MSVGPNFAFDLCVRKTTPEQRASLDLSSWDMAGNGAEPVRAQTLQQFAEVFAPSGFRREALYPCYGLAEATLMVATGSGKNFPATRLVRRDALAHHRIVQAQDGDQDACSLVGCELLPDEQQIAIVKPETLNRCADNEVGEIWVAGESVGLGYWQKAEETERIFKSYLPATGEGPFLRSGDLGFIQDGILFVTGRRKDVIIIRGRNHYPQDIEMTVEQCHPAIRLAGCAAFSIEVAEQEQLVVLAEIDPHYQRLRDQEVISSYRKALDAEALSKKIRKEIWEQHDLQPYQVLFVNAGTIPKTSSGKLQRQACRQSYLAGAIVEWDGIDERKSRKNDPAGAMQG